jgi:hypothetical protein
MRTTSMLRWRRYALVSAIVAVVLVAGAACTPTKPPPPSIASLVVTPPSHDFGNVTVLQSSAPFTFTVKNNQTQALAFVKLNASGDVDEFPIDGSVIGSCGRLAPGATCRVTIRFRPRAASPASATYDLVFLAPGTSLSAQAEITVTGTGTPL